MGRAEDLFARLEARGASYLDELISTSKSEEAFLDFKRSADHGKGPHFADGDRANLCKAISGFANSDGGVIVWGVATSGRAAADTASGKSPLADCARFASQIDAAVSGCTVPPVIGVRSVAMPEGDAGQGFVATLVPASERPPHQDALTAKYYIRAGSSFQPATHGILASLFALRAHPELKVNFFPRSNAGSLVVEVRIENVGRGVAQGAYLLLSHLANIPASSAPMETFTRKYSVPGWNAFVSNMQELIYPGVPLHFTALESVPQPGFLERPMVELRYRIGAADLEETRGTVVIDFHALTAESIRHPWD